LRPFLIFYQLLIINWCKCFWVTINTNSGVERTNTLQLRSIIATILDGCWAFDTVDHVTNWILSIRVDKHSPTVSAAFSATTTLGAA
jgi:hypothetical protein